MAAVLEKVKSFKRNSKTEPEEEPVEMLPVEKSFLCIKHTTKYPWGDHSFEAKLLPACVAVGALAFAATTALTTPTGPSTSGKGPILVTLIWIWIYYQGIGAQLAVGTMAMKKQDDGLDHGAAAHLASRVMMNTLEQGVPFLATLWMMAMFVDAAMATNIGLVYTAFRMCFQLAYTYYGEFSMLQEFITVPNYLVIWNFSADLLSYYCGYPPLYIIIGQNFFLWFFVSAFIVLFALNVMWVYPFGAIAVKWNMSQNTKVSLDPSSLV